MTSCPSCLAAPQPRLTGPKKSSPHGHTHGPTASLWVPSLDSSQERLRCLECSRAGGQKKKNSGLEAWPVRAGMCHPCPQEPTPRPSFATSSLAPESAVTPAGSLFLSQALGSAAGSHVTTWLPACFSWLQLCLLNQLPTLASPPAPQTPQTCILSPSCPPSLPIRAAGVGPECHVTGTRLTPAAGLVSPVRGSRQRAGVPPPRLMRINEPQGQMRGTWSRAPYVKAGVIAEPQAHLAPSPSMAVGLGRLSCDPARRTGCVREHTAHPWPTVRERPGRLSSPLGGAGNPSSVKCLTSLTG